jgi:acyl carrier protein
VQFLDQDQPLVTPDVPFRTLSTWDSLTGMAIITVIQDDYGINIPVNDFLKLTTVRELFDYVEKARA